jgi:hypothetical protein
VSLGRKTSVQTFVVLLRGINVGSTRKVPMADLRAICLKLRWQRPETYIQSGNLIVEARGDAQQVRRALEPELAARFGFAVDVVVRTAAAPRPAFTATLNQRLISRSHSSIDAKHCGPVRGSKPKSSGAAPARNLGCSRFSMYSILGFTRNPLRGVRSLTCCWNQKRVAHFITLLPCTSPKYERSSATWPRKQNYASPKNLRRLGTC